MNNGDRMVDASIAYTAIDIAEQEAEERMRQKAVKAYCSDCCCTVVGTCGIVFLDSDAYWFPDRLDQLTLVRKGGSNE